MAAQRVVLCYEVCSSPLRVCAAAQQAKQLADDVRERVKALGFERHKLVVMVRSLASVSTAQVSAKSTPLRLCGGAGHLRPEAGPGAACGVALPVGRPH